MLRTIETRLEPVNDIWWIPIKEVSFRACLEGDPAIGHFDTKTLVEGDSAEEAITNLRSYPGCAENWNRLTLEQKQRIHPFLIDLSKSPEKVLYCERRFRNKGGDYTCGEPVDKNGVPNPKGLNGEFGGCCIMGYDVDLSDCPYKKV